MTRAGDGRGISGEGERGGGGGEARGRGRGRGEGSNSPTSESGVTRPVPEDPEGGRIVPAGGMQKPPGLPGAKRASH